MYTYIPTYTQRTSKESILCIHVYVYVCTYVYVYTYIHIFVYR